jgi:tail tube protein
MTASEKSYVGLAKQTGKGTPNTTDAQFSYLLYKEAALGVMPTFLPLDPEVGGGAPLRNVLKVGVMSGGRLSIIPRPRTLGLGFMGITGAVNSVDGTDGSYEHTFTLSDQFEAPWYTLRSAPGQLIGEQLSDSRVAGLTLGWRAGRFVEGDISFQGIGVPENVSMVGWDALPKVDGGPQFLAPLGTIELPTGTQAYVTAGSFTAGISMPIDEQWIVGSYSPQNLSITQRAYILSLAIKIEDATLYKKIMYDPAGGSAWLSAVMREANFTLEFKSDIEAAMGKPYKFAIAANGETGADANVAWSAQPIAQRAGRQLIMGITGTFLASPDGATPITLSLVNTTASY